MPNSWNVPDQHLDPESYNRSWNAADARQAARDAREGERDVEESAKASESPLARRKRLAAAGYKAEITLGGK